jgi:type IV secretory pathway TraG/TraD family ATPase VirD4
LLQLQGSEKTVAGVIGTASKIFSRFLSPELVSAFCGKTTLPLDLDGKKLLILGLDRQRREAVAPLIATILHMIVTRNVTRKRKDPLILALDELPTLYLPYLTNWLNENRSDGLVTMIGFQNLNQLEKTYSREISRAILGGCATKAIFNPQEHESARAFSDYLGEEEIGTKQKSRSTGKSGGSTSTSDQIHKRYLVEAAQFNRFPTGKCVFVNPAYLRKDEGSIPLILNIKVPVKDLEEEDWSKSKWEKVRARLIENSHQVFNSEEESKAEIDRKMAIAQYLFPAPDAPPSKSLLEQLGDVF